MDLNCNLDVLVREGALPNRTRGHDPMSEVVQSTRAKIADAFKGSHKIQARRKVA